MKKKFNYKLTLALVSLFISLLLIIIGNKNKYCLFFGFLFLAVSVVIFAKLRIDKINKILKETEIEIDKDDEPDVEFLTEVYKELAVLRRQKRSTAISFYLFSALLVIVSFFFLF